LDGGKSKERYSTNLEVQLTKTDKAFHIMGGKGRKERGRKDGIVNGFLESGEYPLKRQAIPGSGCRHARKNSRQKLVEKRPKGKTERKPSSKKGGTIQGGEKSLPLETSSDKRPRSVVDQVR